MTGEFHNIKIQGMASAVPEYTEDNMSYTSVLGERRTKKQIRLTGVSKRHISSKYQRTSDLCYTAATALLDKLRWDKKDIKVFIMVTQSANYNIPSTSFFLQKRLGLGKDCIVFDVNLGCSSFNAGVHIASSLLQSCNVSDKALLVVGDTSGAMMQPEDKLDADVCADSILFGSAGAAIAIEKVENHNLYFMNKSDGNGFEAIIGHFGRPTVMDGPAVFEFAINDVADDAKLFKEEFGLGEQDIDYYVFHQAQKLILDNIAAALDIPEEKELRSLEEYGNTSGTSVPVSVCANCDKFKDKDTVKLYLCGFGIGLSWGSIYTEIDTENILPVIETNEHFDKDKMPGAALRDKHILIVGADKPMGEHLARYLDDMSAYTIVCGTDKGILESLSDDLFWDSEVFSYQGESEKLPEKMAEFLLDKEIQLDGIVISDECVDAKLLSDWGKDTNFLKCLQPEASVVFTAGADKEHSDRYQKVISEWEELLDEKQGRVNAVFYDMDKIDLRQIIGDGHDWVQQFLAEGCPMEMKQSIHIGNVVKQLLHDDSSCVSGNMIQTK